MTARKKKKTDPATEAMARQAEIMKALHAAGAPFDTAARVRALMEAIWATAHNEGLDQKSMLDCMCLLGGMSVAALHDYAKLLDENEKALEEKAKAEEAAEASDGWIKWEGGECPVPKGTLVDVRHRDGDEYLATKALTVGDAALFWDHSDDEDGGDIVAYRLSAQPDKDGWIKWHGVGYPKHLPLTTEVEVRLRRGKPSPRIQTVDGWRGNKNRDDRDDPEYSNWAHSGSGLDIVAYRVHKGGE